MKIAIVSDTHFGYKWDGERAGDCFDNAREAFRRTRDADLVILPGDIYDQKRPKQEVLGRSIDCFNEYKTGDCTLTVTNKSDVDYEFMGTPLVAIHGTHERRSKGYTNPIELLDTMGYLLHLHNEKAVFEHAETGETVAVHGMSGVPERYAPGVLEKFDPEPVKDAYNIFVFHQSVENVVYTSKDHPTLKLEHLPDGFDLLVDGHIHWYDLSNADSDKPLILPGSTISTQRRKVEAEKPKGFVTVDTKTDEVEFHSLEHPRELFYRELDVDGMSTTDIHSAIDDELQDVTGQDFDKKPLLRLILEGETDATVKLSEIREAYEDDCVLSLSKRFDTASTDISAQTFDQNTKSIAEMGREMLRSKLDTNTLQVENLFELLAEEQLDDALEYVEELELPDEAEEQTEQQGGNRGRGR
jgi:DNA repair exonuclease SbcCD nuclease subunit